MAKGFCIISAVLIVYLFSGCQSTPIPSGTILVFGHAGAGMGILHTPHPPNSKESILSAVDFHGADGVEIDIQISKDSVLLAYHDNDLRSQTDCSGCLQLKTKEEIESCRYRRNFVASGESGGLVQIEEIINHFASYATIPRLSLNVQLQHDCLPYEAWLPYDLAFIRNLNQLISANNAYDWIWIESENIEFLDRIQEVNDSLKTFYIQSISEQSIQKALGAGCTGMVCELSETDKKDVELARGQNLRVSIYNANIRKDIKSAIKLEPNYIQTDNIVLTRQLLREE